MSKASGDWAVLARTTEWSGDLVEYLAQLRLASQQLFSWNGSLKGSKRLRRGVEFGRCGHWSGYWRVSSWLWISSDTIGGRVVDAEVDSRWSGAVVEVGVKTAPRGHSDGAEPPSQAPSLRRVLWWTMSDCAGHYTVTSSLDLLPPRPPHRSIVALPAADLIAYTASRLLTFILGYHGLQASPSPVYAIFFFLIVVHVLNLPCSYLMAGGSLPSYVAAPRPSIVIILSRSRLYA
ncbi:hypothetical protein GGX14DRAFT_394111 [Mycena pura]|uniref:Uncharacterized protein n=1 Tax=Mycena pura TaxID=153505 RepID=A0AAD6VF87_9AGAR|nr:hypothetical protein GGX14DRAFT_394111 [Mycena pura]